MRILLVDDEQDILDILTEFLESSGHYVTQAINGAEAYEIFSNDPSLDMILTDISMPVMNGLELIEKIRKTKSKIKIIVISTNDCTAEYMKKFKILAVINKPFRLEALRAQLEAIKLSKDALLIE